MSYLSVACSRLAMSDRESIRSEVGGELARVIMSLITLLDSERLMGSLGASESRLESGWGTEIMSLKTVDTWDRILFGKRS